MFSPEEIELGKTALSIAASSDVAHQRVVALRMLSKECGWSLRRADQVLSHLLGLPELGRGMD